MSKRTRGKVTLLFALCLLLGLSSGAFAPRVAAHSTEYTFSIPIKLAPANATWVDCSGSNTHWYVGKDTGNVNQNGGQYTEEAKLLFQAQDGTNYWCGFTAAWGHVTCNFSCVFRSDYFTDLYYQVGGTWYKIEHLGGSATSSYTGQTTAFGQYADYFTNFEAVTGVGCGSGCYWYVTAINSALGSGVG